MAVLVIFSWFVSSALARRSVREFLVEARNSSGSAASNNEPFVPLRVAVSFATKEGPPSISLIKYLVHWILWGPWAYICGPQHVRCGHT